MIVTMFTEQLITLLDGRHMLTPGGRTKRQDKYPKRTVNSWTGSGHLAPLDRKMVQLRQCSDSSTNVPN